MTLLNCKLSSWDPVIKKTRHLITISQLVFKTRRRNIVPCVTRFIQMREILKYRFHFYIIYRYNNAVSFHDKHRTAGNAWTAACIATQVESRISPVDRMNQRSRSLGTDRSSLYGTRLRGLRDRNFSRTFTQCRRVNQYGSWRIRTTHAIRQWEHPGSLQQYLGMRLQNCDRCTESYFRVKLISLTWLLDF